MNELFTKLDYSIDWGLLFSVIGFVAFTITWLKKIFRRSDKEIKLKECSLSSPVVKADELANHLKIIFNGKEIDQLNKLEIYIENSGRKALNSNDFHLIPQINLSGFTNITSIRISTSNEFTKWEAATENDSQLSIKLSDFEPNDFIKIEILFESISNEFEPTFQYQLKEKKLEKRDLNRFWIASDYSMRTAYDAYFYIIGIVCIYFLSVSYFTVKWVFKIDLTNRESIGLGWKFLYYTPTILACIIAVYKHSKYIDRTFSGYTKIKNWHESPLIIRDKNNSKII